MMDDTAFAFVIMSFSNNRPLQRAYRTAIKPIVTEFAYRCERVDEQEFNTRITDRILDNIQRANFIIADVTDARPNCYYELGVAHAIGNLGGRVRGQRIEENRVQLILEVAGVGPRLPSGRRHPRRLRDANSRDRLPREGPR